MKIILIVLIALVVFGGCTPTVPEDTNPPVPDTGSYNNVPESPPQTDEPAPEKELPYAFVLSPDFDRSEGIINPNDEKYHIAGAPVEYDFNEVDWNEFPSGDWSIDELEKKYGKANKIYGTLEITDSVGITGTWDNLNVLFTIPRNGTMSFDLDSNPRHEFYDLSTEDKAIKMPIYRIDVFGEDMPLPRGLKIGHSTIEDARAAYPAEGADDGYNVSYNYVYFDKIATKQEIEKADMGYIAYYFDTKGLLYRVEIGLPSKYRSVGI